jgi:magnesium transporter
MHSLIVSENGAFHKDIEPSALNAALAVPANVIWLDVQDPTEDDTALLRDVFGFHPLAIEDAVRSHERPKIDAYAPATSRRMDPSGLMPTVLHESGALQQDAQTGEAGEPEEKVAPRVRRGELDSSGPGSYYFVVFYAASFKPLEDAIDTQAINLFIGSNYLVTVHYGPMHQVSDTLSRWQAPNSPLGSRISALVWALLDAIVDDYFPLTDRLTERIEELEDKIFLRFDQKALLAIFGLKRDLLNLRRVVAPERDVLNVLLRRELPIFKSKDMAYFQDIYDHIVRLTDNIDTSRDLLTSALDSFLSIQSNKLNQIMKLLTMGSILLMSNSLIAGIYGMNFRFMPELELQWGYPFALGLMLVVDVMLIMFFRRRELW